MTFVSISPSESAAPFSTETTARVLHILEQYLSELERGIAPEREELMARHPDLVEPLNHYLASLDLLHGAAIALYPGKSAAPDQEDRLGDYQLLCEVGRGGMGVVYEAVQVSLGRRVALKVLAFAAALDARQLQRFRREAEAAAHLQHPHIVPVYAVGQERGIHFYVMPFIEGHNLAEVIGELRRKGTWDRRRSEQTILWSPHGTSLPGPECLNKATEVELSFSPPLPVHPTGDTAPQPAGRESSPVRLNPEHFRFVAQLGLQAAEALDYAHQGGIIHRDIKPANLILDAVGNLWLTDFGLARFADNADLTTSGDLLGTLRYMSPEQASARRGLIDQRTDIYSLGVTLYEMLTLEPAFPGQDRQEVLRQIALEEPRLPRRLNRSIPRDLETIVLKSIAKCPEDRYGTAQELGDDLRRFLNDEAIHARRPAAMQRLWHWSRRHKAWMAAGGLTLVLACLVLAGSTAVIWRAEHEALESRDWARRQQGIAEHQRQVAEQNLGVAAEALDELLSLTERAAEESAMDAASQQRMRSQLQKVLEAYEHFARENGGNPRARQLRAKAFWRAANVDQRLNRQVDAARSYESASTLFQELVDEAPNNPEYACDLAVCLRNLGRLQGHGGNITEAQRTLEHAVEIQRGVLPLVQGNALIEYRRQLADTCHDLGRVLQMNGRSRRAVETYRQALDWLGPDQSGQADPLLVQSVRASNLQDLAQTLETIGQPKEGEQAYRQGLALRQQLVRAEPSNREFRFQLAALEHNYAMLLANSGRAREAQTMLGDGLALLRELSHECPTIPNFRFSLASGYANLAGMLSAAGQNSEAEANLREARRILEALALDYSTTPAYAQNLADTIHNHAALVASLGRLEEAVALYREALPIEEALVRSNLQSPAILHGHAATLNNLAIVLRDLGRKQEALGLIDRAYQEQLEATRLNPDHHLGRRILGNVRTVQGELLLDLGRRQEAAAIATWLEQEGSGSWDYLRRAALLWGACAARAEEDSSLPQASRESEVNSDLDHARKAFQQAVLRTSGNPSICNALAWSILHAPHPALRNVAQASDLARQATAKAPEDADHWLTAGAAEYRAGKWASARKSLERAQQLATGPNRFTLLYLAMASWQLGDKRQARQWFDRLQILPEDKVMRDTEFTQLAAEMRKLLAISPAETRSRR